MIHPLNLGILAANRQTRNKRARKQTVPATSAEPKDTTPNEGKCVEGKSTEALPKVTLLMMRMTDPVSEPEPVPESVSGVVSEVVSVVVTNSSSEYHRTTWTDPTSGWLEVEHYPDSLRCVVNVRSMTSARTLALEVLTIKFSQLPSAICESR